jgi:membrane dipeptidase
VRWMLCAYNKSNALGGGCHDDDSGLTRRGREWLAEMNRVGMVACGSHTGYRTAREMIERNAAPTIFSHSNPRALCDHPRNIPDDLIVACAARGGVIGINGVGIFLGANDARPERLAQHIDHVVQLVGVAHVGLGTDYVFGLEALADELAAAKSSFPAGFGYDAPIAFMPPEDLPAVAAALKRRGYSVADRAAIFGGNFERIARDVWKPVA